jgi:hypothetical protein
MGFNSGSRNAVAGRLTQICYIKLIKRMQSARCILKRKAQILGKHFKLKLLPKISNFGI